MAYRAKSKRRSKTTTRRGASKRANYSGRTARPRKRAVRSRRSTSAKRSPQRITLVIRHEQGGMGSASPLGNAHAQTIAIKRASL